ncbi:MAG TPA: hypothetical protein VI954_00970, partial [Candidatus Paceibacterota bacterium]
MDLAFKALVTEPDMPGFSHISLAMRASKSPIFGFCFAVPTLNCFQETLFVHVDNLVGLRINLGTDNMTHRVFKRPIHLLPGIEHI